MFSHIWVFIQNTQFKKQPPVLSRDHRENLTERCADLGLKLVAATISGGIAVKEAQSMQRNVFQYSHKLRTALDYMELMRRRIRAVFWKRWKRVRTRWRKLEKLGISHSNAGILANSKKGHWRIASRPILQATLSNLRLEKAGFQFFEPYCKSVMA